MSTAQILNADVVTQYLGMIVRQGLAPNTCLLAQADTQAHSLGMLGTRITNVPAGNLGPLGGFGNGMTVRLEGAAADGDAIYLSATTAGVGTNVAPAFPVFLGEGYSTYQISGVWYAYLLEVSQPPKVPPTINAQVGASYQVKASDSSDLCTLVTLDNANPVPITVPKQTTTPLPVGFSSNYQQIGVGKVTFVPEDGTVTIEPSGTLSLSAQWKAASLTKVGTNAWTLVGSLSS